MLVVEDKPVFGMSLAVALELRGFRIAGPYSGYGDAVARLTGGRPDCAVVNVGLKDGSGLEIARELRGRGVPLVLVSQADAFGPEAPGEWTGTPWMGKPVAAAHLAHILDALARPQPPRGEAA